ncbi:MAG: hypothetical protein U1F15_15145 [Burkholderiales bacterium]
MTGASSGRRLAWAVLAAVCMAAGRALAQTQAAVEYHHAAWNHYFITAFPDEISALDGGAFGGAWTRTGQTFDVYAPSAADTKPACRFFSTSFAPRSSHFYTPFETECGNLRNSADWQFEAIAFHLRLTDASGACPAGTTALYRLYNDGMGGAPNHRYTTRRETVDEMRAMGWQSEGSGPDVIFACVPPSGAGGTTAAGMWVGTTSAGEGVRAIVLEDGTYYILYAPSGDATTVGFVQGSARAVNGTITSTDGMDFPVGGEGDTSETGERAVVSGTYAPRGSLQLTIEKIRGARTLTASYDASSERPASLAALEGTYYGTSGNGNGGSIATFNFDANGNMVGGNGVCNYKAKATPHLSVGVFDVSLVGITDGCIIGTGFPISGILYYDEARRQVQILAPFAARADSYHVVGAKR